MTIWEKLNLNCFEIILAQIRQKTFNYIVFEKKFCSISPAAA